MAGATHDGEQPHQSKTAVTTACREGPRQARPTFWSPPCLQSPGFEARRWRSSHLNHRNVASTGSADVGHRLANIDRSDELRVVARVEVAHQSIHVLSMHPDHSQPASRAGSSCTPPTPTGRKAFYGDLFGWTASDSGPEYGGYIIFERDGEPIAGLHAATTARAGRASGPSTSHSDDAAKTAELARQHGASGPISSRCRSATWATWPSRSTRRVRRSACGSPRSTPASRRPRRGRRADLVRDAEPGLRQVHGVLPRRLRLGPPHDERHRRVPLHARSARTTAPRPGSWTARASWASSRRAGSSTSRSRTPTPRSRRPWRRAPRSSRRPTDTPYGRLAFLEDPEGACSRWCRASRPDSGVPSSQARMASSCWSRVGGATWSSRVTSAPSAAKKRSGGPGSVSRPEGRVLDVESSPGSRPGPTRRPRRACAPCPPVRRPRPAARATARRPSRRTPPRPPR